MVIYAGDSYKFGHPKTRELLYDQIPPPIKQEFHLRAADKMEIANQQTKTYSSSDISYHYDKAKNIRKAVEYSLLASKDALEKFSYAEAIEHSSYILENMNEPKNLLLQATALERLGDAYYASMRFREAAKTFELLSNVEGANKLRALRKAMGAYFFQNDLYHLDELLKKTDNITIEDQLERARILHNKAMGLYFEGTNWRWS